MGYNLAEFQTTIERLFEIERPGLMRYVWTQKREIGGQEHFEMAVVRGLSDEGKCLVTEHKRLAQNYMPRTPRSGFSTR